MFGVSSLMNLPREVVRGSRQSRSTSDSGGVPGSNDWESGNSATKDAASVPPGAHDSGGIAQLPGRTSQLVFLCVGIMTAVSSILGSSANIVFLECAAGVAAGGRTGFAAVVTGMMFFFAVFLSPVFRNVPTCASSPALLLIGALMMNGARRIDWDDFGKAFPAFLTICMMPFTSGITPGILFGLGFYVVIHVPSWVYTTYRRWAGLSMRDLEDRGKDETYPIIGGNNNPSSSGAGGLTAQRQSSFGVYPVGPSSFLPNDRYEGNFGDPPSKEIQRKRSSQQGIIIPPQGDPTTRGSSVVSAQGGIN